MSAAISTTHPPLARASLPIRLYPVVYFDDLGTAHYPDGRFTRCARVEVARLRKGTLEFHDRICTGCDGTRGKGRRGR